MWLVSVIHLALLSELEKAGCRCVPAVCTGEEVAQVLKFFVYWSFLSHRYNFFSLFFLSLRRYNFFVKQ